MSSVFHVFATDTVGSDTNIQGVCACWCRRNSPIRDAPSLQQIPTCSTFCFKNLGFLSSRLVRAPGKKAHRLMTPHLWSTLQGAPWIIHMHFGTIHAKSLGALPGEAQLNLQQIDQASTASSQSYLSGIVALVAVMSTWMLFVIHICVAADFFCAESHCDTVTSILYHHFRHLCGKGAMNRAIPHDIFLVKVPPSRCGSWD